MAYSAWLFQLPGEAQSARRQRNKRRELFLPESVICLALDVDVVTVQRPAGLCELPRQQQGGTLIVNSGGCW
jgi:hypothetical protein